MNVHATTQEEILLGFAAMRQRRNQLAATIRPGTEFRAAKIMTELIAFVKSECRGNIAMERALLSEVSPLQHRGKGGGRPHHESHRYVAQDKRDARKARNRR